jgi:nucleotide-binding universal stress UspA family protein
MTSSPAPAAVFVVGYDGSEAATAALIHAAHRCGDTGRVVVACAHQLAPRDLSEAAQRALTEQHVADARSVLDALALDAPGELEEVTWSAEAIGGDPATALCRLAEREEAAEIIVGTHGRGRVSALLGSVAHDLLRRSDRPVTAIPPKAVARLLAARAPAGA